MADKPAIYRRMRDMRFGQLSQREVREGIRHFWAYCTYLDDLFGRLLVQLEQIGQADNTLVLYCSDHGDYCGEHGLFAKGIPCFNGAYQVPAVVRWPKGIANPGRRVDDFVSLADFAPTFIELAAEPGAATDRHFAGASLVPFLRDKRPPAWRDAIHTQCNGVELYYTQRSVMTRDFKYVFNGFDRDELYDLRADADELRNVADDPAYAQVVREMCRRMWRFAYREDDSAINPYITVGLAPYGPAEAFRGQDTVPD
jgi:arylsulfatase A-like enzyme